MSTTRLGVQKILDHILSERDAKLGLLGFFGHPRPADFTSQVGRIQGENGRGGQVSESKPFCLRVLWEKSGIPCILELCEMAK